jgi:phenylacetate-coenzyme A ligase PaaK-like adenylate-forming protein
MESFDIAVTDPRINLQGVQEHLRAMTLNELYLGRFRVASTSGSSGLKGVFLWDFDEWTWILASYARAYQWSGMPLSVLKKFKMAIVGSTVPWHQSSLIGAEFNSRAFHTLRLDSTEPLSVLVAKLNDFSPNTLAGYASILDALCEEQLSRRLRIFPRTVLSVSEVLTNTTREKIAETWGCIPFNTYASTETASMAAECDRHMGMHICDDLVILEVVDEKNKPVPPGVTGAKVLVTVLFSRTLPLIRYEMSDQLTLDEAMCSCGRPFFLMQNIEGRLEDFLMMSSDTGDSVSVSPNVFHRALEKFPLDGWQVVMRKDGLEIRVINKGIGLSDSIVSSVREELERLRVTLPAIYIRTVDHLERGATGKLHLVMREPELIDTNGV